MRTVYCLSCFCFPLPASWVPFLVFSIYPTYSVGTGVLSREWSLQGMKLTSHLLLVPILRMSGDIPRLHSYAFMAWALTALPSRFTSTLLSPFLFCFLCPCKCVNANWSMRLSLRAARISFITATNFIKTLPLPPTHGVVSPLVVCQQGAPLGLSPVISVGVLGLYCTVPRTAILTFIGS